MLSVVSMLFLSTQVPMTYTAEALTSTALACISLSFPSSYPKLSRTWELATTGGLTSPCQLCHPRDSPGVGTMKISVRTTRDFQVVMSVKPVTHHVRCLPSASVAT